MESFLQVGVLLGDGLLEDGLLELKICRQSASPGERVAGRASCRESELFWWSHFVGCFDLLVSAFVFYCNCYLFLFVTGRLG